MKDELGILEDEFDDLKDVFKVYYSVALPRAKELEYTPHCDKCEYIFITRGLQPLVMSPFIGLFFFLFVYHSAISYPTKTYHHKNSLV